MSSPNTPEAPLEFSFFVQVDEENKILAWPVDSWDVMERVKATSLPATISQDWPEYKRVFHVDQPAEVLFNKVVMVQPVFKNGRFYKTWALHPYTPEQIEEYIQQAKVRVNDGINAARLEANNGFFIHGGKKVACDSLSRSDIDGMNGIVQITKQLPPGWIGYWKAIDNTRLPITTYEEWVLFYSSMYMQGMKHFSHAQYLKGMLDSARSLDEVNAISWQTKTPYLG